MDFAFIHQKPEIQKEFTYENQKRTQSNLLAPYRIHLGIRLCRKKVGGALGPLRITNRTSSGVRLGRPADAVRRPGWQNARKNRQWKIVLTAGILCGPMHFIASFCSRSALRTTASKAGFITSLYAIIVPIICFHWKTHPSDRLDQLRSRVTGLSDFHERRKFHPAVRGSSDSLCAVFFALQILIIDHYSPKCSGSKCHASVPGIWEAGVICMFIFETHPRDHHTTGSLSPTGVFSTGIIHPADHRTENTPATGYRLSSA